MLWAVRQALRLRVAVVLSTLVLAAVALSAIGGGNRLVPLKRAPGHGEHKPGPRAKGDDGLLRSRPFTPHLERGPFIDGSDAPEKISDHIAYSHFFRVLMRVDRTDNALKRQRSYVKHILATAGAGQAKNPACPVRDEDVQAVLRFAATYATQLKELDAKNIRNRELGPFVSEVVVSMPRHLGASLASRVDWYVQNQFKRRIKVLLPMVPQDRSTIHP